MTADIRLPARLDTSAAEGLRHALARRAGRPVSLKADNVEHIGGLCLEEILLARRRWAASGTQFSVAGLGAAARADLRAFGLDPDDLNSGGAE